MQAIALSIQFIHKKNISAGFLPDSQGVYKFYIFQFYIFKVFVTLLFKIYYYIKRAYGILRKPFICAIINHPDIIPN